MHEHEWLAASTIEIRDREAGNGDGVDGQPPDGPLQTERRARHRSGNEAIEYGEHDRERDEGERDRHGDTVGLARKFDAAQDDEAMRDG